MSLIEQIKKAKDASLLLASISSEAKNNALGYLITAIKEYNGKIIRENKRDIDKAMIGNLSQSLIQRLALNDKKINEMIDIVDSVKNLEDPIGKTMEKMQMDTNLMLEKITVPIGL